MKFKFKQKKPETLFHEFETPEGNVWIAEEPQTFFNKYFKLKDSVYRDLTSDETQEKAQQEQLTSAIVENEEGLKKNPEELKVGVIEDVRKI